MSDLICINGGVLFSLISRVGSGNQQVFKVPRMFKRLMFCDGQRDNMAVNLIIFVGYRSIQLHVLYKEMVETKYEILAILVPLSVTIGLYLDVWIAAIASSRTRLVILTGEMCKTSQCELRSLRVNSGMLNVIRIVTYYTLPPLESPDSFWIAMAISR